MVKFMCEVVGGGLSLRVARPAVFQIYRYGSPVGIKWGGR